MISWFSLLHGVFKNSYHVEIISGNVSEKKVVPIDSRLIWVSMKLEYGYYYY